MPKPSVLFIGVLPPHPGGSATQGAALLNGLDRLGHKVVAISPMVVTCEQHDRSRLNAGVTVHAVPSERIRNSSWTSPMSEIEEECRRILKIACKVADAKPPDVILLGRPDFEEPAFEIATKLGIAVVAIDHGPASAHLEGFLSVPPAYRMDRIRKRADGIVAVANYRAANLRANGFRNVTAIPNAADPALFRPGVTDRQLIDCLALPRDAALIAHVSSATSVKRIGDYLAAMMRIAESNARVHALVVGDHTACADDMARARSLGLQEHVTFTGWLDLERVAMIYRTVEMIVQPSEIEAGPLSVLEAMASQCPVLASDIPAHRELIEHDRTGVLVPVGDVDALAGSILDCLNAPNRRRELAAAAYARWQGRTSDKMIARYSAVLSKISESKRSSLRTGPWPDHEQAV